MTTEQEFYAASNRQKCRSFPPSFSAIHRIRPSKMSRSLSPSVRSEHITSGTAAFLSCTGIKMRRFLFAKTIVLTKQLRVLFPFAMSFYSFLLFPKQYFSSAWCVRILLVSTSRQRRRCSDCSSSFVRSGSPSFANNSSAGMKCFF